MINKFSILNGEKHFSLEIFQNNFVFIPAKKCIKYFSGTTRIESWKSDGMLEEKIENISKSVCNFAPSCLFITNFCLPDPDMNFNGHCLLNNNISTPKKVINLYISYTLGPQLRNLNTDFTLVHCLFGSVKYTDSAIGFNSRSEFLFTDRSYGKNVIIFGVDVSSSVHVDNNGKDVLILGKGNTRITRHNINNKSKISY